GQSRRVAGSHLTDRGVPEEYLRRLEKLIHTAIHRAKALFHDLASAAGVRQSSPEMPVQVVPRVWYNQQQAMMTSVFFVMVPMFFFSGLPFWALRCLDFGSGKGSTSPVAHACKNI
nr:hypothetical protein [Spirochaeta sp.]